MYLIQPNLVHLSREYFGYQKERKKNPTRMSSLVEEPKKMLGETIDGEEGVEMIYFGSVQDSYVYSMSPWPDPWPPTLPVLAEHPRERNLSTVCLPSRDCTLLIWLLLLVERKCRDEEYFIFFPLADTMDLYVDSPGVELVLVAKV